MKAQLTMEAILQPGDPIKPVSRLATGELSERELFSQPDAVCAQCVKSCKQRLALVQCSKYSRN